MSSKASISVVKIGGNVVDNPDALARFLDAFVALPGRKILVHGGGKEATRLSSALGIETTMIDGRRVTGRDTLDVVTMVYAGLVNKRVVAALQARGCTGAIGMSGADAALVTATRRPAEPVDYGFVGDLADDAVDAARLASLLDAGMVPVVCAIMHDGRGTLLNCNADSVAAAMAVGASRIAPTRLVYCFEKDGVLADVDDPSSLIPLIDSEGYPRLRRDGVIAGGMIPKIDNAFAAIGKGVGSVSIINADNLLSNRGTTITR